MINAPSGPEENQPHPISMRVRVQRDDGDKELAVSELAVDMIRRLDDLDDVFAHNEERLHSKEDALKLVRELVTQVERRGLGNFEISFQDDVDGLSIVEFSMM